jgi:hypothetical protein
LKARYLYENYNLLQGAILGIIRDEGLDMIFVDFGRFGKAKIARPTVLEVVAMVAFLGFVGAAIWAVR